MSTETELMELMELSSAARQLIAHCDATGHFVSDSRAALICGVNLRNLTHTLAPAVFHGKLRRVRDESGVMGYRIAVNECAQEPQNGTATPQKSPTGPEIKSSRTGLDVCLDQKAGKPVAAKSPAKRSRRLPPLDLAAIPMGLEPKVDGRATSQKRTWDPLFEALAAQQITGGLLPTKRLPPEYGGAVQAAASTWNKERKDGKKIRVARLPDAAVVQREI